MREHRSSKLPDRDRLSQLAREDPLAFEKLRSELIADFIDGQPEKCQRRLRGLQFRIDGIRQLSHTPLAALLKMQALMWESFFSMNQELQNFVKFVHGDSVTTEETTPVMINSSRTCQVIELPQQPSKE